MRSSIASVSGEHERLLVVAERMAVPVGVRHVAGARRERLERRAQRRHAGDRERAQRGAVVRGARAITLCRWPCPMARKYWRASFHADSTASEPPVVKNTRLRSPGARSARRAASSIAGRVRVASRSGSTRASRPAARGLGEVVAAVADLHGEQAGQAVEVAGCPVRVPQVAALAAGDDRDRRVVARTRRAA